jgi:hypothetical protein
MKLIVHIISKNYTKLDKYTINYDDILPTDNNTFLNYLLDKNLIENVNHKIYHNNQEIFELPKKDCVLVISEQLGQTNRFCSCVKNI